jgi:hypothetical protein|nr:MAG TPA: tail protein [Caudoviricetes sp.]
MIQVLLYPDALSLVGSMNAFEIYNDSETDVVFALRYQGAEQNIVQHTYTPNDNHRVTVSVKDIILPLLSFDVRDSIEPYIQQNIMKKFVASVYEVGNEGSKKEFSFSVIRAGVDGLADSAANFLKTNFLTWQPQVKEVTYYSPEFLTYYAAEASEVKCKAYLWNGATYDEKVLTLASLEAGNVYTVPVQYAIIAKLIGKDALPHCYEIWVEQAGERVTYVQQYFAGGMKSEEEEWFLFENSLGGVDCFRAYGNSENTAEHTHNVAEIEDDSEEYRVDTTRKFKKNTGYLDKKERQWLLDFFPSLGKYVYHGSSLRKITVIESDVNYEAKELPSNYTFTYKYSDARPYLNLSRSEVGSFKQMDIQLPDLGNFTIAPRLVECSRLTLSSGALFPVQSPYSEEWGVTTLAAILESLVGNLSDSYSGGGGVGHRHSNIEVLDALSEFNGYLRFLDQKIKAGFADETDDFSENGKANRKILRKDIADVAEKLIRFAEGARFGDFVAGINGGKGAQIDTLGNAEVESITVRSYMKVMELIVNRLTALEGDQLFTESDTIESVSYLGDNCYGLHLRQKYKGYFTAQHVNNVLKGIVNNLATAAVEGTEALYYTSWMRVNSVNAVSNYIEVSLYPDDEVPAGKNFPPCELMNIARWGNQTDESLQQCFYLSSSEGRIVKLTGVTKPILENWNYGMVFGDMPSFLKEMNLPLMKDRDYMYAAGIITQDIIQIDYQGKPVVTYVDRGNFDETAQYYCASLNDETGKYETSDVWYTGCKWRCQKTGTHAVPRWNSTDWAMIEGNPAFSVDFQEAEAIYDFDNFIAPLTIVATLYGQDITDDILDTDVAWTRYTENSQGVQRVTSDNVWAEKRGGAGKSIVLTQEDLSLDSDGVPKKISFTATVILRDGMGNEADRQSVSLDYMKP